MIGGAGEHHGCHVARNCFSFTFKKRVLSSEEEGETLVSYADSFSQTYKEEAYVHFIGVNPKYRRRGIASTLYSYFFDVARANNRKVVKAITSPVNKKSIQFHKEIGFQIEAGDDEIEGVSVHTNYDGMAVVEFYF